MVHTLSPTVAVGVVGARGNFTNAKELVEGIREFGAKLLAIVGKQAFRTAIVLDVVVDENIRCASSSEIASSDCVHRCVSAEAISEEQNVGVAAISNGQRAEVVERHEVARSIRKLHGDHRPAYGLARGLASLTLEASSDPETRGCFHANPPVEAFEKR